MVRKDKRTLNTVAGFTLTEILISLFILALGIVGVMSLFPVALDATTRAINNQVVYLASQAGFAQANIMVNTSELFDYRLRRPYYQVSPNFPQSPTTVTVQVIRRQESRDVNASRATWQPPLATSVNRVGYYLTVISGTGARQTRKIVGIGSPEPGIPTSRQEIRVDRPFLGPPPPDQSQPVPIKLDGTSTIVMTRWALPPTPGSARAALVDTAGGTSITAKDITSSLTNKVPVTWGINEFDPNVGAVPNTDARFFVVFTSGLARGKVVPVTSHSGATINVEPGQFSPTDPDTNWLSTRVRPNDSFLVLGTKEVDAVYPFSPDPTKSYQSNFGKGGYAIKQTIPYGAAMYTPQGIPGCPYSYVIIMSNMEDVNKMPSWTASTWARLSIPVPRDAFVPDPYSRGKEVSTAPSARVDVLVFLNYDYGRTIQDQSPLTLIGTASTTITSFF